VPKYGTPQSRKAFFDRLDERLAARQGVADATVASDVPLVPLYAPSQTLAIEGRSNDTPPSISHVYVGARYFETLGLRVIQGRTFTSSDGQAGHQVAIVSQRFAAMHFPNEDPLGRRIRLVAANAAARSPAAPWTTIVGVAPTIPEVAIREPDPPLVYLPVRGDPAPGRSVSVIVRSDAGLASIRTWLRDDGRALDPDLPWYYIQSMDPIVAQTRESLRMTGALFGLLAVIGVVLSAVGLYALTAHGVAQRVHEIGIRMALGAQTSEVVWLFMQRTLVQVAIGLILGLGGALSVGRLIQSSLVQTSPRDPTTLISICLLLVVVALFAAFVPARRAARIDPVVALRYE
jgi:putative ABC transport system permease protein